MMRIYDSHTHSSFSFDGEVPPEEMIRASIKAGLSGICFTDHMDPDFGENGTEWTFDPEPYFKTLLPLFDKYEDKIILAAGMEFGMQPHLGPCFLKLTETFRFNHIIGSQHLVYGEDPYEREVFQKHGAKDVVREYYDELAEGLPSFPGITTLGHMEYIFRYIPDTETVGPEPYLERIRDVLQYLIGHGIALEFNTGSHGNAAKVREEIFRIYKSMGGNAVTIGSDAHTAARLGEGFSEAAGVLKKMGFGSYGFFTKKGMLRVNI